MATKKEHPGVPKEGPFVRCAAIENGGQDGWRIYRPGPVEYFFDGREVTKEEFDAARR